MRKIFGLFLCILFLSGCNGASANMEMNVLEKNSEIKLFVTSDIHYLSTKLTDHGAIFNKMVSGGDGKRVDYITEITDAFLDEAIAQKPTALILSGDLTLNGEKLSHKELAKKLECVQSSGVPVLVIPGNHDVNNPFSVGYQKNRVYDADNISETEFRDIYGRFGYDNAIYEDEESLSYVAEIAEDVWIFMIDTSVYRYGYVDSYGRIGESTLLWLQDCFAEARRKGITPITVTHHNLMNHNPLMNVGYTIKNSKAAVELFMENEVPLNLSGHIHMQHISEQESDGRIIYDIASESLAVSPNQYGVVHIFADKEIAYRTQQVDVDSWALRNHKKDENLLHFSAYAAAAFSESAFNKAADSLAKVGQTAKTEEMARFISTLNANYFAGTIDQVRESLLTDEAYAFWSELDEESFFKNYINSILLYENIAGNQLSITK